MSEQTLTLSSAVVHQWHCDHFGHMNTRHYAALFDDAVFLLWGRLGFVPPAVDEHGVIPVTAEMKTTFVAQALPGQIVTLRAAIVRIGSKSVTLRLDMLEGVAARLLASCEVVEVFFDTRAHSSSPIPGAIQARLQEIHTT